MYNCNSLSLQDILELCAAAESKSWGNYSCVVWQTVAAHFSRSTFGQARPFKCHHMKHQGGRDVFDKATCRAARVRGEKVFFLKRFYPSTASFSPTRKGFSGYDRGSAKEMFGVWPRVQKLTRFIESSEPTYFDAMSP